MAYFIMVLFQDYLLFYFDFWPCLILGILEILAYFVTRQIFHEESMSDNSIILVQNLVQWVLFTIVPHAIITKIGLIYVASDFVREGQEDLLNNLEEGLIIFDQNSKEV